MILGVKHVQPFFFRGRSDGVCLFRCGQLFFFFFFLNLVGFVPGVNFSLGGWGLGEDQFGWEETGFVLGSYICSFFEGIFVRF